MLAGRDFNLTASATSIPPCWPSTIRSIGCASTIGQENINCSWSRVSQRKAEIDALEQDIVMQNKLVGIQQQQFDMRQTLVNDGNVSKKQVLESEALLEQARGLVTTTEGRLSTDPGSAPGSTRSAGRV